MLEINDWPEVMKCPIERQAKDGKNYSDPDALEEVLRKAVRACAQVCLSRNGRIFTTLSGGLDSSLCTALIREEMGTHTTIKTITIGSSFEHPDVIHAGLVAEKLKTDHYAFVPTQEDISWAKRIKKTHPEIFLCEASDEMGGIGTLLLYYNIYIFFAAVPAVIVHDGIDELMGGYWEHRKYTDPKQRKASFVSLWKKLPRSHLIPLTRKADYFSTSLLFPYLQKSVVDYITAIPLAERTSKTESKILLRRIAEKYLPPEIIERRKLGLCHALELPET